MALAGPPKSAKNRGGALIQDSALNRANTVTYDDNYCCLQVPADISRYPCVHPETKYWTALTFAAVHGHISVVQVGICLRGNPY